MIQTYKDLGINYITLVNNKSDVLFLDSRLTDFGKCVIEKMNEVDIKIDISHLDEGEMLEVIKYSKAPVIASHSNARHIARMDYNLSNKVLEEIKRNQGLVLLSFNTNGLYETDNRIKDEIEQLADHIDYLKTIIGINRIGLGTDLQAYGKYVPSGLSNEETYMNIQNLLITRGYPINEIELIFYKNYINFMK